MGMTQNENTLRELGRYLERKNYLLDTRIERGCLLVTYRGIDLADVTIVDNEVHGISEFQIYNLLVAYAVDYASDFQGVFESISEIQ